MPKPKRGLGKGLEALFQDNETADVAVRTLPINDIEPNAAQPRREFDEVAIAELADSISKHGVLSPLLVRPLSNGRYQIVAGERRWRASRIAGLEEIPVVVRELTDENAYELALVENLIREDLNPLEEAMGFRTLQESFSMTQDKIAQRVGKSRSTVANALRILNLPPEILELLKQNKITGGHAKVLLSMENEDMLTVSQMIVEEGLSVRATEKLVKKLQKKEDTAPPPPPPPSPSFYVEMELALKENLKRKVKVSKKKNGHGEITIEFYSEEELKELGKKLVP
ncbi:MAG: ParB/RepB/Spo0J family partition protein [Oscillospiraceae bacterium]